MKMVEKLQGSELASSSQHTRFSKQDDAINSMVYDYLRHHHMYYTLSVFASECSSIQQKPVSSLDPCPWKDILDSLDINNCNIEYENGAASGETKCLLNCVLNAFEKNSNKKHESKSCQCDVESKPEKLLLNTQSQTDAPVNTLSVQTLSSHHIETQTEDNLNNLPAKRSSDELNSEIVELQNKLEQSQSALMLCQAKLLDAEKKIECLVSYRKERTTVPAEHVLKIQSPSTYNTRDRITCEKRIQEASRFLNHLDGRLQFLDQKFQNIVTTGSRVEIGSEYGHENLRFLPDSNLPACL